jgi:hypothetical protein
MDGDLALWAERWVGTLAIQVRSSAGTASIHLGVYPSALSLLWRRYCAMLKPLIYFSFILFAVCFVRVGGEPKGVSHNTSETAMLSSQ